MNSFGGIISGYVRLTAEWRLEFPRAPLVLSTLTVKNNTLHDNYHNYLFCFVMTITVHCQSEAENKNPFLNLHCMQVYIIIL